jgi:hypothetical protein
MGPHNKYAPGLGGKLNGQIERASKGLSGSSLNKSPRGKEPVQHRSKREEPNRGKR